MRSKENEGRNLPKADELKGPGKIPRRGHCKSSKDTETVMVRPNKDGRRKHNEERDGV